MESLIDSIGDAKFVEKLPYLNKTGPGEYTVTIDQVREGLKYSDDQPFIAVDLTVVDAEPGSSMAPGDRACHFISRSKSKKAKDKHLLDLNNVFSVLLGVKPSSVSTEAVRKLLDDKAFGQTVKVSVARLNDESDFMVVRFATLPQ